MLINLIMETLSQCVCTSNHHTMHFKYITFVNYTSIKLENIKIINTLNIQDL